MQERSPALRAWGGLMPCMCGDSECWSCGSAQDTREPSSVLTIRLLLRQADGTLKWEDHCWNAPVDAANPAAVRAEVLRHTRDYLASQTHAGVWWNPETCARPVDGMH